MRVRPTWDELLPTADAKAAFEDASAALEAGRMVRKMRAAAGLTQAQLASRIAVSQARVSAIENGDGRDGPSFAVMKRIGLACGAAWLIEPGSAVPTEQTAQPKRQPVVGESITLREEAVSIERYVGDTGGEVVVSKTARVREEVVVTERIETVRDTVRREDVTIGKDASRDHSRDRETA